MNLYIHSAIKDLSLDQSAFRNICTFRGFIFCIDGFILQSAMTIPWSPRPGRQFTRRAKVGFVVRKRSKTLFCRVGLGHQENQEKVHKFIYVSSLVSKLVSFQAM